MHTGKFEVLVKDIKCNKFTRSRAECLLSPLCVVGRCECFADEDRIPLVHQLLVSLMELGFRTGVSRAYPSTCPRMLRAFYQACVKLKTVRRLGNEALHPYTMLPPVIMRVGYRVVCPNSLLMSQRW